MKPRIRVQGAGEKQQTDRVRKVGRESYWGCVGDMRLSLALDDSDEITRLHFQGTWLCDFPHTTPLRRPGL